MEVAIPNSLEALVRRKVGRAVVAMKRDRLRAALDRGYEDVWAGRVIPLDSDKAIDILFADLQGNSVPETTGEGPER